MSIEELKNRIKELEAQLQYERENKNETVARPKITQMSAEVVDSNPYRLANLTYGTMP